MNPHLSSLCSCLLKKILLAAWISLAAVTAVSAQPKITGQPKSQFVDSGKNVSFVVTSSGAPPLTYQWSFNGLEVSGATNRTLTLTNTQPTETGDYSAVVSNGSGSVTSQVARLKVFVVALHAFANMVPTADGSVALTMTGESPARFGSFYDLYPVEVSSNLVDWVPLVTLVRTNDTLSPLDYVDSSASSFNQRFYRTVTNLLITPLPPLTGPYPVGSFSRLMIDPSRTNSVRRTNQQFMVTFWYPAAASAGVLPAPYLDQQIINSMSTFLGYDVSLLLPTLVGHSLSNAPLAGDQRTYPIMLYSPGLNSTRRENVYKVEELASHGFIVVGLDTRNTFASVFPNGKVVLGPAADGNNYRSLLAAIVDHAADENFVIDELGRMNTGDSVFARRLELDRIGAFGHSAGGAAAAEVCRTDPRCKAGINMDGSFVVSNLVQTALSTPFMVLRADDPDSKLPDGRPDDRKLVIEAMTHDGYFVRISGTVHVSYKDYPLLFQNSLLDSLFGGDARHPLIPGVRINQIASTYVLSFFKKYLKNEDDHLLDGPPAEFPEVIEFLRK
jgi:predicted dienelactone hydrolase